MVEPGLTTEAQNSDRPFGQLDVSDTSISRAKSHKSLITSLNSRDTTVHHTIHVKYTYEWPVFIYKLYNMHCYNMLYIFVEPSF